MKKEPSYDGSLCKCEVDFTEEKQLVENIIERLPSKPSLDSSRYYAFIRSVEAVEKSLSDFNFAVIRIWFASFLGSMFRLPNGDLDTSIELTPQNTEPRPLDSGDIVMMQILDYFKKNDFQKASDDLLQDLANLYSSAWRVLNTLSKEFKNVKPSGITTVRNHIIEHPFKNYHWIIAQMRFSHTEPPVFIYLNGLKKGEDDIKEELEVDVERDFREFKSAINRKLTTLLSELRN